ncbi:MAG TPA: 50S ribosomal protein L1 [Deltaproteobacteria bacterium]|nr:50S ribosomal protein L1 [Deltaproteobacteria bacterium]HCP47609.1 50S ribosomal protein L1 [Deltaproteobacteria bacterium]
MGRRAGKNQRAAREKVDSEKLYTLKEAIELLKACNYTKFDQSVDVAVRLGVDPKHADQMVRGAVALPHGIGKSVRVLVFAKGDKVAEARDAGADFVGGDDLVEKIKGGWLEFDKVCATPDMMAAVGKIGRVLGPRGLMPNPKTGTVTFDIGRTVADLKGGKIDFRVEKAGIVHAPIGRMSFDNDKLEENMRSLVEALQKMKPSSAKGTYMKGISVSGTMTPGIRIDAPALLRELR